MDAKVTVKGLSPYADDVYAPWQVQRLMQWLAATAAMPLGTAAQAVYHMPDIIRDDAKEASITYQTPTDVPGGLNIWYEMTLRHDPDAGMQVVTEYLQGYEGDTILVSRVGDLVGLPSEAKYRAGEGLVPLMVIHDERWGLLSLLAHPQGWTLRPVMRAILRAAYPDDDD